MKVRSALIAVTTAVLLSAPATAHATWSGTVSGTTGTLAHDSSSAEPLTIFEVGGALAHDQALNNPDFVGQADFDSSTPGVQGIPNGAANSLSIAGGGQSDEVTFGASGSPWSSIANPISVDGGAGVDLLNFVNDGDAVGRGVTVVDSNVLLGSAPPISHANVERLQMRLGNGDDTLTVASDTPPLEDVQTMAGNDLVVPQDGVGVGTATGVHGGAGTDTLDYGPWTTPVSVVSDPVAPPGEVTAEATGTATAIGFENFRGGSAADNLVGNYLANELEGRGGNDDLTGGAGSDTLLGGADDDRLRARDGEADAAIDCGDGTADVADRDLASIDPNSILAGCETVNTTPVPPPPPAGGGGGDDDPPETAIDSGPKRKVKAKRKKAKVTFGFSSNETGASFECSLDGEAFASCTSPHTEKVKKGEHEFAVRSKDAAGNVDATPAEQSFKVKKKRKRK